MLTKTDTSNALEAPRWILDETTGDFLGIDATTGEYIIYRVTVTPPLALNAAEESTLEDIEAQLMPPLQVAGSVSVSTVPALSIDTLPLPPNAAQEMGGNLGAIADNTAALVANKQALPTNAAQETGGNLAAIATNTTGAAKDASLATINTTLGTPFQAGGLIGNAKFGAIVENPPDGTPLVVQPLSHDIDNILSPVASAQSGAWNVGQLGTWNVGQSGGWSVSITGPTVDANGAIVLSPQSLISIDPSPRLAQLNDLMRAQLLLAITQAQAAGGGFVPYEMPPF